jgi:hypothetical protein
MKTYSGIVLVALLCVLACQNEVLSQPSRAASQGGSVRKRLDNLELPAMSKHAVLDPLPAGTPGVIGVVTAATEAPSNSDVIYAVTNYDTVFVTRNAGLGNGATWEQITEYRNPGGISAVRVDPTNYQIAYLACDSGVYKTTDMGMSWTQYGIPDLIYRDVAIDSANPQHIFAASNAGVLASTDGGMTWGNMSEGIPAGRWLARSPLMPRAGSLPLPPMAAEFTCST